MPVATRDGSPATTASSDERGGHQRQPGDREALVAPGARDARPDSVVETVMPSIAGTSSSPASVGRRAGRRLQEQRHEHGDREQRGGAEEQRGAGDRHRPACAAGANGTIGSAARRSRTTQRRRRATTRRRDQRRGSSPSPRRSASPPQMQVEHQGARRAGQQRGARRRRAGGRARVGVRRRQAQVQARRARRAPSGRLTKKTQRQLAWSTSTPPISGPTTVATAKVAAM